VRGGRSHREKAELFHQQFAMAFEQTQLVFHRLKQLPGRVSAVALCPQLPDELQLVRDLIAFISQRALGNAQVRQESLISHMCAPPKETLMQLLPPPLCLDRVRRPDVCD
jgi:hypothetical protein